MIALEDIAHNHLPLDVNRALVVLSTRNIDDNNILPIHLNYVHIIILEQVHAYLLWVIRQILEILLYFSRILNS